MFVITKNWYELLKDELNSQKFLSFKNWLEQEYKTKTIYPKPENVFNALNNVKFNDVKVVIIGQDPYHQPNQAHGLSFSVEKDIVMPPSLINIFKELVSNTGCKFPSSGNLTKWAQQGVLLLNSVLTVEEGKPNSHKGKGWEQITTKIIKLLSDRIEPVIFLLWGNNAKEFAKFINKDKHFILTASHPSPMSANQGGWFGNKCFSKTNEILVKNGKTPINWEL
jgi:uracil-DNA glycosylase